MRREFLKSNFHNPNMEKLVEFEIKDYDDAVKNSKHPQPQNCPQVPIPTSPTSDTKPPEPEIKQEPMEEPSPSPVVTEPAPTKVPMALRKLQSNLDGKAWECTDTHRPRFRVRTTGIQEEDEYLDHWDIIMQAEENKFLEEE